VFEELKLNSTDTIVAEHKDINDIAQTVSIKAPPTNPPATTNPPVTTGPPITTEPTSPPYTSGGTDPYVPPAPTAPGNTLIADGDEWIELDADGTPLATWTWDEEAWIFEDIPLGDLPPTGHYGIPSSLFFLMSITLVGILFVAVRKSLKATK